MKYGIYILGMSLALDKSLATQHFENGDALQLCDRQTNIQFWQLNCIIVIL